MEYQTLEKKLFKSILIQRIIMGLFIVIFLVLFVVCSYLKEATKEVVVHENAFFTWEEVVYNKNYDYGIILGISVFFIASTIFIGHLVGCKFKTVEASSYHITIYKGYFCNIVYIDGEEKDRLDFFRFTHVIETELPNAVRVTISFSRNIWYIAHISFSNNTPSIDV